MWLLRDRGIPPLQNHGACYGARASRAFSRFLLRAIAWTTRRDARAATRRRLLGRGLPYAPSVTFSRISSLLPRQNLLRTTSPPACLPSSLQPALITPTHPIRARLFCPAFLGRAGISSYQPRHGGRDLPVTHKTCLTAFLPLLPGARSITWTSSVGRTQPRHLPSKLRALQNHRQHAAGRATTTANAFPRQRLSAFEFLLAHHFTHGPSRILGVSTRARCTDTYTLLR